VSDSPRSVRRAIRFKICSPFDVSALYQRQKLLISPRAWFNLKSLLATKRLPACFRICAVHRYPGVFTAGD
jgi:hypothetical protein